MRAAGISGCARPREAWENGRPFVKKQDAMSSRGRDLSSPEASGQAEPPLLPLIDDLPHFLTRKQAAYALGDNETATSIGRLIKRRLLRSIRVGGEDFVFTDSVRELRAVRALRGGCRPA